MNSTQNSTLRNELSQFIMDANRNLFVLNLFSDKSKSDLLVIVKAAKVEDILEIALSDKAIDSLLKNPLLDLYWDQVWQDANREMYPQHGVHSLDQMKSQYLLKKYIKSNDMPEQMLVQAAKLGSFSAIHAYARHVLNKQTVNINQDEIDQLYSIISDSIYSHQNAGAILFINTSFQLIQRLSNFNDKKYEGQIIKWVMDAREYLFFLDLLDNYFSISTHNAFHSSHIELSLPDNIKEFLENTYNFSDHQLEQLKTQAMEKIAYLKAVYETVDPRFYTYEDECKNKCLNHTSMRK